MYSLYEGKNDYCVRIGRNIAIWTCWLNKKLTCWLCGYEWGGTNKLKLAINIFLANWLVNEDFHGF